MFGQLVFAAVPVNGAWAHTAIPADIIRLPIVRGWVQVPKADDEWTLNGKDSNPLTRN